MQDMLNFLQTKMILSSANLVKSLRLMERALQQSLHHKVQLRYRGFKLQNEKTLKLNPPNQNPTLIDPMCDKKKQQKMKILFQLQCNLTKGRPLRCLCWHKVSTVNII